jgi:hypothetical protein
MSMISRHQHDDDFDERQRQRLERQWEAEARSQNESPPERPSWIRPTPTYNAMAPQSKTRRRK